jgi:hypothetical protein
VSARLSVAEELVHKKHFNTEIAIAEETREMDPVESLIKYEHSTQPRTS